MKSRVIRSLTTEGNRSARRAQPGDAARRADQAPGTRVKVDEDLPRQIAEMLSARGHDAITVLDQGWQGTPDDDLWPRVQSEGRWLVTADKGFADLRRYPPGSHAGVILLRSQEESRAAYLELAAIAFNQVELEKLSGAVVVVTNRGVRIRRAPDP